MGLQVNYVGKAANLYEDAGYNLHGSAYVINKYLGTTWLWDRVRVSGGAYGGFSDFDSHSGMFTYLSYRDPNLLKTVDNYDGKLNPFCRPACARCFWRHAAFLGMLQLLRCVQHDVRSPIPAHSQKITCA